MSKITFRFILCITLLIHSTVLTIAEDESLLEPEINADIMSTEPDTEKDTDSDDAVPEKGEEEIAVEEAEATQEEKEELNEVNFAITPFVIETLSPSEAVVTTFDDFYTVLSQDNGITTVYLGSDIDIKAGGIALHKNKTSVIIDGISPLDATGTKHKLSEYTSSNYGDCIRVTDTNGTKNVTLRNLVIVGRNYYGTVYISDSVSNVVITYESVEYKGPQITYNTKGTARYIDTSIVIDNGNGGSPRNEVAEIRYVEFGGTVSIYHYSTVNRLFYLWGGAGSITVLDGADVNIMVNDASISLLYGNATDFIIGNNASFAYSGKSVFNENSITSLTVKEGGRFSVISTGASLSARFVYDRRY